jgi:type III pantothenate kinase
MNLLLDMGNSYCKVAVVKQNEWLFNGRFEKNPLSELKKLLKDFPEIRYAMVSSVQSHSKEVIQFLAPRTLCFELHQQTRLPIKIQYKTLETLGKDRIAAACGAAALFPAKNILIIDAGTCIKYDFVSSQNTYCGGAIAPGIAMRFKALHQFTDRLPLLSFNPNLNPDLCGDSTEASLLSGVLNAVRFEAMGFIDKYLKLHSDLTILVSGGDTAFFENALKIPIFARPELSLLGLYEILKCNVSQ